MDRELETTTTLISAAHEDEASINISINRQVYNEAFIRSRLYHCKEKISLRKRLKQKLRCTSAKAKATVLSFLPILTWLPTYPVKEYLFSDIISGLSTGMVQLPQGLAYAMLASVPPVYGLYSSLYPVILYTFLGTSRHISVGTFAVISLMIGGVAVREAPDSMFYLEHANEFNVSSSLARDERRVQVAVVLTTLVGIIQILLGILRFGFVAIYLTEPLVRGFTTAASVHVVVSQLKYLLGVKTRRFSGPLSVVYSLKALFSNITSSNSTTVLLGLACLIFLYAIKYLNERFKKKLLIPIPGEIIVVIVSTGVSFGMKLSENYGLEIVGNIPTGLLPPVIPDFSLLPNLITDAVAIAIVSFSMGISLAKTFAIQHNYSVDGNQELIALGLCNFLSSFFQTFTITCSMSRSLVQESTGGKTQIAGLVGSLVVLVVVVAIGFVFEPLPQTALAAIIMVNLVGMFKQLRDIPHLWRTSKVELVIWVVAFTAAVLLGLDYGLLVAIGVALLTVIYRTQTPKESILGHVPGTGLYFDADEYEEAAECEGIKIFHFNSPIYFANSDAYVSVLKKKTGVNPELIHTLREARAKKKVKVSYQRKSAEDDPPVEDKEPGVTHEILSYTDEEHKNGALQDREEEEEEEGFLEALDTVHSIVLDWTSTCFIDSVGAKAIKQVIRDYADVDVQVVIAGCSRGLLAELDALLFFTDPIEPKIIFPTVHDAVVYCQGTPPVQRKQR